MTVSVTVWLIDPGGDEVRTVTGAALAELLGGAEIVRHCRHCDDHAHGKPSVPGARERFNVSHTTGLGLVAIGMGVELGVDLERADRRRAADRTRLHRRVLSAREQEAVASLPEDEQDPAFLRLWSAKEAVAKADGRGIVIGLASLEVGGLLTAPTATVATDEATWHVQALSLPEPYAGFLASAEPVEVTVRPWPLAFWVQ